MAKIHKLLVLGFTIWPIIYFSNAYETSPDSIWQVYPNHTILHFRTATFIITLILPIYYVLHLFKNSRLSSTTKVLGAMLFILLSPISIYIQPALMVFYWVTNVWPSHNPKLTVPTATE